MTSPVRPEAAAALTIGALALATGLNVETIRYYQRRGLLPVPERPGGGVRRYGEAERARLLFIKTAQRLGFSLDEVAELLQLDDGGQCRQVQRLAENKLQDVQARLAELACMAQALTDLLACCDGLDGPVRCGLIEALSQQARAATARP